MTYAQLKQHAADIVEAAIKQKKEDVKKLAEGTPASPIFTDEQLEQYRNTYQQAVDTAFAPYYSIPKPASYDPIINDLHQATRELSTKGGAADPVIGGRVTANPLLERMETASNDLLVWHGQAADNFREKFLDPFDSYSSNQFVFVAAMKGAMDAHKAMWVEAQKDIAQIAESTLESFDKAADHCPGSNEASIEFTVLAAVGTIGGAAVTVATGGGAAAVFAVVGAFGAMGGAAQQLGDKTKKSVSGTTADAIIDAMKKRADDLTKEIQDTESGIASHLKSIKKVLDDNEAEVVAKRPSLAKLPDDDLTGDRGLGEAS